MGGRGINRDSNHFKNVPTEQIDIVEANLTCEPHCRDIVLMIDSYASDPMSNGMPLPETVRRDLIPGLRAHPTTLIFLAYHGPRPVGIAVCFRGFSTFAARPLINIHDLAVVPEHRGRGIGRRLLEAVERKARELGCCKLTLEVLENNARARRMYGAAGFEQAAYDTTSGGALFFWKTL